MDLSIASLKDSKQWEQADIRLPQYDVEEVHRITMESPIWLHFGGGNIFRGFIASLQHNLLNQGLTDKGIVVAETFDGEIVDKIYNPFDNLTLDVRLFADGSIDCQVVSSVAKALHGDGSNAQEYDQLMSVFENSSLQLISFTITEKGYALTNRDGSLTELAKSDMKKGPQYARHAVGIVAAGMYARYLAGASPIALISMDNCARNGDRLREAVLTVVQAWTENGLVEPGFIAYVEDEKLVAFPWTMIDKITPRPAKAVETMLEERGITGMETVVTSRQTYIAPFVNAENSQYLVVEDRFPGGRPPLEQAGVYMTDRETVEKTERMKVTTCLNPLHTAMSIYGCLLGYQSISEEMQDQEIVNLIRRLGYQEGLPVVVDPKILSPHDFLQEVIQQRLPNPFIPDTPQRIATDTSQKMAVRFGETIKSWQGESLEQLVAVPLTIAGWFRYLLAVDDMGKKMDISPDPLKEELQAELSSVVWNDPGSYQGQLLPVLKHSNLFGLDLTKTILVSRIEGYFTEMLGGEGAVRRTLKKHLD